MNKIVFPNHIRGVSISFIQGLMETELKQYGIEKIFEHFSFYSTHEDVISSILGSVVF